jgi:hypothetical protein
MTCVCDYRTAIIKTKESTMEKWLTLHQAPEHQSVEPPQEN